MLLLFMWERNYTQRNSPYPMIRKGNPGETQKLTEWACISCNGLHLLQIRSTRIKSQWYCEILNEIMALFHLRHQKKHAFPKGRCSTTLQFCDSSDFEHWLKVPHLQNFLKSTFWFWFHLRQRAYSLGFKYANNIVLEQEHATKKC